MIFRILHRVRYHTVFLHDRDAPRSPAGAQRTETRENLRRK